MSDEGQSLLALAEQRRQQPVALLNRVRSAFTKQVMGFVCGNLNVHMAIQAGEAVKCWI